MRAHQLSELQAELAAGRQGRLVYYAFDLLWRMAISQSLPQIERKHTCWNFFGENDVELTGSLFRTPHRDGQVMFEHAAKLNWEGIISKRADAPYSSERTEAWLKIKTVQREKFPVIGFVKDPTGVAALYLASGRERAGLYGKGRHRLVAHRLQSNSQAAGHGGESEVQAHQADQEAEGHMG
jgi:bifunctional non-homologous end joining protein LigD